MIPWDYNGIDEYYYPYEEYHYCHVEINKRYGEEVVTHHLSEVDKIPYLDDINYFFGYLNIH